MADLPILLPVLLLFLSDHSFCVTTLSDYKICGDPQCESPMSRVQATRHHKEHDCRFLNFKRGDVIIVYYKLSGKRDDLWAGAIDQKFGYFPKEAVEIEEIYTQGEIETQTQEQDFFCIDEHGMIPDGELDNHINQNEDEEAAVNVKRHQSQSAKESPSTTIKDEFTETGEDIQTAQDNSDNVKQKSGEQGASYWIGSRVTGWLGLGGQSDDGSQEQTLEQDSFKSTKLSLDVDGNQIVQEPPSEASGWLEGGLTNIFGFGQRNPVINVEESDKRDKLTHQDIDQSSVRTQNYEEAGIMHQDEPVRGSPWLDIGISGISDIFSFNKGNGETTGENTHPETRVDEKIDTDNEIPASMLSTHSQVGVNQDKKSKESKEGTHKRGGNTDTHLVGSHINFIKEKGDDYSGEKIKEQDLFYINKYGMNTEGESDNHVNQNKDEEASANVKQHQKRKESTKESQSTAEKDEFTETEDSKTMVQVNPDTVKEKSTEKGGSSWIGSRVSGWLGLGDQSDDVSQEQTKEQDSFRSRKLSLDIDGNQLGKRPPSEASGWLEGGLTNIFGFGQRKPEINVEETDEKDKLTHQDIDQSSVGTQNYEEAGITHQDEPVHGSSWLEIGVRGISDILSFNKGNYEALGEKRHPETRVDEKLDTDNEIPASMLSAVSQVGVDQDEKSKEAKEETSKGEENSDSKPGVENGNDITLDNSQGEVNHKLSSDEEEKGIHDESVKGVKSIFSADSVSSMFSRLTLMSKPNIAYIEKVAQNNKGSAAELTNEGRGPSLEAQTNIIDESIEGCTEENFDDNADTFERHPSIQQGLESYENVYKSEQMSDQKPASEETTLDNESPDLPRDSNDYSVQSDYLDRVIGTLNDKTYLEQETPESNNLESAVQVESPDSSGQLQDNNKQMNNLQTETELTQLLEKPNLNDRNSEELLSEQNNLDNFKIPVNKTDTSENFTDQVVIHHSGGPVGIESTGVPIQNASAQSLVEEKMSYVELTKTSDEHNAREAPKLDIAMDPKDFRAHESKEHGNENNQSPTADHITQIHTPSSTKASVNKQAEKPGFSQVDVPVTDIDETPKNTATEEGKVATSTNMITYETWNKYISRGEESKLQKDKENIDINADVTVLKEALLEEKCGPAKTVYFGGCKASSTAAKGKNTLTSPGCNVEDDSEMEINGDLKLRSPNEKNMQTNQESPDTMVDPPTQSSYLNVQKSNEFYENIKPKHWSDMPNIEKQTMTEANLVINGEGVHPAQDLEELENSTLIQLDLGTKTISTSRPKDFLDFSQSDPNYFAQATADGLLKQTKQQKRDISSDEIKSHDDIQNVDGNVEQTDPQNVIGDHHKLLPCSHSQTESCIKVVDGKKVYQTSADKVKTGLPKKTLHSDQARMFLKVTPESLERDSFLTESQLGENTPNRKSFEHEQFSNVVEGETVPQAESSVFNYGHSEAQFAHQMNREVNGNTNLNQQIDEVNGKTALEKGELLSEINGNVLISDKTSDDEEEISVISHSTSHASNFSTKYENNTAFLVEDSPIKTITKHMEEPLEEDMDTEVISQIKQYGDKMLLEYKNMQLHFTIKEVQYFLAAFGKRKLLWLDYCLGNTEIGDDVQNNDNLSILSDFEDILKYHSEIISTSTKSTQVDRNMKEEEIHGKNISLKKLEDLLSTLRSKYTMMKPAVTINEIQGMGKPECTTTDCFSAKTRQDSKAGLGVREDSEEIDWKTGLNVEGGILNTDTSSESTRKPHGDTEVRGTLFTDQLIFTILEKVSLIYIPLKWLITEVKNECKTWTELCTHVSLL